MVNMIIFNILIQLFFPIVTDNFLECCKQCPLFRLQQYGPPIKLCDMHITPSYYC